MDQETALGVLLAGHSAFITGAAGAGKTYLLNEFIRRAKKSKKRVAKTASTGIAATLLSGNTIHSWTGLGVKNHIDARFIEKLPKRRKELISTADILIIDEISMIKDWFLDLVNEVCKAVRISSRPFGGLQVVFSGDFTQLPPINRADEQEKIGRLAYLSDAWQELDPVVCYLNSQYRQEDLEFVSILNALRTASYRRHHIEQLLSRKGQKLPGNYISLYTTNTNVDRLNNRYLNDIKKEEKVYTARFTGSSSYIEKLKASVLAPEILRLKIGALVMSLKNDQSGRFSNGSIGTVIDFDNETNNPIVKFNNGHIVTMAKDIWERRDEDRRLASMTQIPLKLAWAITIHKSQGMTLDSIEVDLRNVFSPGMGYVALSRVKSLSSLSLLGIGKNALIVSPEAVKMNKVWQKSAEKAAIQFKNLREQF